jgi:cobalamin biosynthesis Co2+ chelatase CbiK
LYLETEQFNELLKENIDDLKKKLDNVKNGEKILDNILRANEFGITERYRVFFEEIKLKISQAEMEAIRGRHLFVHGHARFDEIEWEQVIRQVNTLHTLFNKTLLKILEYKWDYIDRSVEGWNDVQLD